MMPTTKKNSPKFLDVVLKMTGQEPGEMLVGTNVTPSANEKIISGDAALNTEGIPDSGEAISSGLAGDEDIDLDSIDLSFSVLFDEATNMWRCFCGITQIAALNPAALSKENWLSYQKAFLGQAAINPKDEVFGDHILEVAKRRWIKTLQDSVKNKLDVANTIHSEDPTKSNPLPELDIQQAAGDETAAPIGSTSGIPDKAGAPAPANAGLGGGAPAGAGMTQIRAQEILEEEDVPSDIKTAGTENIEETVPNISPKSINNYQKMPRVIKLLRQVEAAYGTDLVKTVDPEKQLSMVLSNKGNPPERRLRHNKTKKSLIKTNKRRKNFDEGALLPNNRELRDN
jgi:hypothetical protein